MTAARDREHDAWIPWYLEDTAGWLELSLAARGAAAEVARKMGQRRKGELALPRGLSALAVLLRVRWEDLEPAIAELVASGRLTWDGALLVDPDWDSRQRSSSAKRMRTKRALASVPAPEPQEGDAPVTARHEASQGVTPRHVASPSTSTSRSRSDLSEGVQGETSTALSRTEPLTDDARMVFATIAMNRPVGEEVETTWAKFTGHYAGRLFAGREPIMGLWQKWVTTQAGYAEKARHKDRERADQEAERKRFLRDGPERPPPPTPEQAKRFAENLSARILGSRKVGS